MTSRPAKTPASASRTPSYRGRQPASAHASAAARGSSKKSDTRCEVLLRSVLWRDGCRFRKNVSNLPGNPDIVFTRCRVAIFCDGDFWHGRHWEERRRKLQAGTNAAYWVEKIRRNRERDREYTHLLEEGGWLVLRFWETDILADPDGIAQEVLRVVDQRGHRNTPAISSDRPSVDLTDSCRMA
ncbi:MAG: very short patch repair endonuclease [Thermoanaerobaculia bacterium]